MKKKLKAETESNQKNFFFFYSPLTELCFIRETVDANISEETEGETSSILTKEWRALGHLNNRSNGVV